MRIKNMIYANTPIATKLGTFIPDANGELDAADDVAKMLCALAGFTSMERTPRVLAPAAPVPPAPDPVPAPEVPSVLAMPEEAPAPLASPEAPEDAPETPVVEPPPSRLRGPKPK